MGTSGWSRPIHPTHYRIRFESGALRIDTAEAGRVDMAPRVTLDAGLGHPEVVPPSSDSTRLSAGLVVSRRGMPLWQEICGAEHRGEQ